MTGTRLHLIGLGAGGVLLGLSFLILGYDNTWKLWNIPTMSPFFFDVRVITGASESRALDFDPLQVNPRDPARRPMNYPRIWLTLCPTDVNLGHTIYFGLTFIILFLVGVVVYATGILDDVSASLVSCGVFSPAVMFSLERANSDLLMFFLTAIAIFFLSRSSNLSRVAGIASICCAFVLKLYPLFAFAFLLRERRSTMIQLGLFVLAIGVLYTVLTYDDLVLIRQGTPKGMELSYGRNVAWLNAQQHSAILGDILRLVSYAAVFAAMVLTFLGAFGRGFGSDVETQESDRKRIDAFRIGSGIYLGTFLLGNNWDYRLMFLLFTIPQLTAWARSRANRTSRIATTVIAAILISMWYLIFRWVLGFIPAGDVISFALDELADWTIFFGLAYLIGCSAPRWRRGIASHEPVSVAHRA